LFAFLLSPGVVFAQEKKLNHLTISYPSISGAQAVLWIAKEMGLFKKNGLDVDLVYIGGGPRSMAALLSGQLQIIGTGGNSLVAANLNGAKDAVLIATTYNTLVFSLMTRATLKEPKDLKGRSLGVTGFGSLSDFTLRTLLKKSGLDPTRDVVIRPMGGYPEIVASMQSGSLDGGIISPPTNIKAQELGFRELIDAPDRWASNMPPPVTERPADLFGINERRSRNLPVHLPKLSIALKPIKPVRSK
jgi:ABC-type nitrate/sulfonate/bicarbonate transport system substrate-binding protein